MIRLLVFTLLVAVVVDFSMPDAVLLLANVRAVQSDDEEESVPSRRQRVGAEERQVAALPGAPESVETAHTKPSTERRAHADRMSSQKIWRVPFRQALMSSVRSSSPLDAH